MVTRREFVGAAALSAAVPGLMLTGACSGEDRYGAAARALRAPLRISDDPATLQHELVRCATLAANGHNAQPWRFAFTPGEVVLAPDYSRRTPAVDPDDHHLWTSLGCAAENLVIAAAALGRHAELKIGPENVRIALDKGPALASPLVNAIFQRQSTRADFDGRPLAAGVLQELARAGQRDGVRLLLLTDRVAINGVVDYVTQANSAQMRDPAFVRELMTWIRFNRAAALASGDGLFAGAAGSPTAPDWLGRPLFKLFFNEKSGNDNYARQLRSSAGVAIFVAERARPVSWFEAGRAFEQFALAATVRGVRTALVNQPVEVPAVRTQFGQWLGLGMQRPDLVVRFGYAAPLPYSLRRPVAACLT